jgi:hypothetical protein
METASMPPSVAFPTIVHEAWAIFGEGFETEAARRPCAAYLTGLMGAERKPVRGSHRACVLTTDPSCLKRWLTEVPWDVTPRNAKRLAWRPQAPQPRASGRGGMATVAVRKENRRWKHRIVEQHGFELRRGQACGPLGHISF